MNIEATLCPDLSETLDRPYSPHYTKMPTGGTPREAIRAMGGAPATIQFGVTVADELSPGKYLEDTFGVPLYNLPLPIGLANTDAFIDALHRITGQPVPDSFTDERGRLLDAMVDSHKYNFQGRCAIFGDAELVSAVTDTCRENGIHPVLVATGGKSPLLTARLTSLLTDGVCESEIIETADFVTIREKCQAAGVNLAIGHSDGRYLTEKSGIPLVRLGFPILDRVGGQRLLSVGYTGTAMLLDRLTNTLLENKHKTYRNTMYERFYPDSDRKRSLKLAR
jgi:nitrogenase molybdenum-iron protein NifN